MLLYQREPIQRKCSTCRVMVRRKTPHQREEKKGVAYFSGVETWGSNAASETPTTPPWPTQWTDVKAGTGGSLLFLAGPEKKGQIVGRTHGFPYFCLHEHTVQPGYHFRIGKAIPPETNNKGRSKCYRIASGFCMGIFLMCYFWFTHRTGETTCPLMEMIQKGWKMYSLSSLPIITQS